MIIMDNYIDNLIDESVKEVVEANKNLPKGFVSASTTHLLDYSPVEGMQIQITVGYNLDEDE